MPADILSLPCSGDRKRKFGRLQAKQLGHHPAPQPMRQQHGGSHESPLCHTKGLAFWSEAVGIHHENTTFKLWFWNSILLTFCFVLSSTVIHCKGTAIVNVRVLNAPVRTQIYILIHMRQLMWAKSAIVALLTRSFAISSSTVYSVNLIVHTMHFAAQPYRKKQPR